MAYSTFLDSASNDLICAIQPGRRRQLSRLVSSQIGQSSGQCCFPSHIHFDAIALPPAPAEKPDVAPPLERLNLSSTKRTVLKAVYELGATEEAKKVTAPVIGTRAKMAPDARLRNELAGLRDLKLLGGFKGVQGYWLTDAGIREVQLSRGAA